MAGREDGEGTPRIRRRVTLRTLVILRALLAGPARSADLIAAAEERVGAGAFGRQPLFALRRDLQALRSAGFAVRYTPQSGQYVLDRLGASGALSSEQARALGILRRSVGDDLPFGEVLRAALTTIVESLPDDLRVQAERPGLRFELRADPPLGAYRPVFVTLEHALVSRRCVQISYRSAGRGVETRRLVEPHDLVLRDRHAYLEAYDLERGHRRHFRIDRIADVTISPRVVQRRVEGGRRILLRLRVSARLARHGPTGLRAVSVHALPDGGAVITAESDSLFWTVRTLLAYGEHVEVLHPPGLRRELHRIAALIAAQHQERGVQAAEERAGYEPA